MGKGIIIEKEKGGKNFFNFLREDDKKGK